MTCSLVDLMERGERKKKLAPLGPSCSRCALNTLCSMNHIEDLEDP